MAREGPIKKELVIRLLRDAISLLSKYYWKPFISCIFCLGKEPNLVKIGEPIVIVGDLHGQFYDLIHMLEKAGDPADINYLFLGDYVDRGIFGIEVLLCLLTIKVSATIFHL